MRDISIGGDYSCPNCGWRLSSAIADPQCICGWRRGTGMNKTLKESLEKKKNDKKQNFFNLE